LSFERRYRYLTLYTVPVMYCIYKYDKLFYCLSIPVLYLRRGRKYLQSYRQIVYRDGTVIY
jgi:hypothetical protein